MGFPRKTVETSVNLYGSGLTLKRARKMVSRIFEMPVKSASAIWYWSREFAKKCCGTIEGLASLLHADETKLKTNVKGK